ncbi:hypothetical protein [Streptomyces lydicus]|uniref:hypothetical protein n=1 Tax=Streptomyces lydicus TaxID=47763 RepID=UPI003799C086
MAADGPTAAARAAAQPSDLVVLDLMLPGMDGWRSAAAAAKTARSRSSCSRRAAREDRILGLGPGRTTTSSKPFSPRGLVLRAQLVLRRAGARAAVQRAPAESRVRAGPLALNPKARRTSRHGTELAEPGANSLPPARSSPIPGAGGALEEAAW